MDSNLWFRARSVTILSLRLRPVRPPQKPRGSFASEPEVQCRDRLRVRDERIRAIRPLLPID